MRTGLSILGLAVLVFLSACAGYAPRPLDGRAELTALASRAMPDVVAMRGPAGGGAAPGAAFDASDGLSEDEAIAVALTLNTDLRAVRAALGETSALLITARVLPNPEIGVGVRPGFGGTPGLTIDADFLFELLRPGERSARVGAAEARADVTRSEILAKEYALATDVRRQVFAVLVAEHVAGLLEEEASLRERAVDFVRRRRAIGEGNELEVSAAELELVELKRDRRLAAVELQRARLELSRLMGLGAHDEVRLSESGKPLTVAVFDDPPDALLADRVLTGRLDLRAREAEYRVAEEELRLEVARQYPKIRLGPSFQHEGVSGNSIGLGASIEVPIFDRNQGGIAEKDAARDRVRAEYTALLHRLIADAFAARARARSARAEIDAQEHEVLPLLKRNQDLYRGAFEARELGVLDWITAQQRALRTRRAYLDSVVAYRQAVLDLDAATGLSITRPPLEQRPSSNPSTDSVPGRKAQE